MVFELKDYTMLHIWSVNFQTIMILFFCFENDADDGLSQSLGGDMANISHSPNGMICSTFDFSVPDLLTETRQILYFSSSTLNWIASGQHGRPITDVTAKRSPVELIKT